MSVIVIAAAAIGLSMFGGSLIGFLFGNIPRRQHDAIMGFASGIMLAAAVIGLIMPAAEEAGKSGFWFVALGIMAGAVFLTLVDKLMPHLHSLTGADTEKHAASKLNKVMLFVIAIAIHKLPEGLAAGVGFGTGGDISGAIAVATGIAVQNVPEGMIIIAPMLNEGVSRRRALAIAAGIAGIEIVGTFLGYFAAVISSAMLPFLLSFAGGTMLYVIGDEMIPETHSAGNERLATYALIIGFIAMLAMEAFL